MGATGLSYDIVSEFRVPARRRADFEAAYGAESAWADQFKHAVGFIDVKLLRSEGCPERYLTIDRWASDDAFNNFQRAFAAEYQALDAQLDGIASSEVCIGSFDECIVA
jgi:heme-degrading monooxygenase HmoA